MKKAGKFPTILICAVLALQSLHGKTAPSLEPRNIANGSNATVFNYPSVVLLVGVTEPVRSCTGSLVSSKWVLTAAHCIDGLALEHPVVSHGYPQYHETRFAAKTVMHPEYDPLEQPGGWAHDPALIQIESEFLSRTTGIVRTADPLDGLLVQPGLSVTIIGWGSEDGDPQSMTATRKQLKTCPEIPAWTVCTESPLVQNGDSGGPVLMQSENDSILVAVNSWREPGTPSRSRYVRVAEHREWIDSVLDGSAKEFVVGCPCQTLLNQRSSNHCVSHWEIPAWA